MTTKILLLDYDYNKTRPDVPDGTKCEVYFEFNADKQLWEIALVFD